MTWDPTRFRDLTLAYLVALHDAANADDVAALHESGLGFAIGEIPDGAALTGVPGWLWNEPGSTLETVLDAATGPRGADAEQSAAATVGHLLNDGTVGDLMDLTERLAAPPSGDDGPRTVPAHPAVLLATAHGRWVTTSLWPTDDSVAGHRWFRSADAPDGTTAAVRRALAPFESLAGEPIDVEPATGYLWPARVGGRPALGLRAALVALARVAGLSAVPASLVATGDSDDNGAFTALDEEEVAARVAGVEHLACAVLVPVPGGWQLIRAGRAAQTAADPTHGLDGAAGLVWGDEWDDWKRRQHERELVGLGWVPLDPTAPLPGQPIPETDVSQVNRLFAGFHRAFQRMNHTVIVLGGTHSSGKSVIVRRLAHRLAQQKNPPLTRVVASTTHELPNREVALRIGRHALGMDAAGTGQRRLLVLEDLHPVGDGNVEDLLLYLSRALGASILGVLQYDVNSAEEWQTDHVDVVTAVVGPQAMATFVDELHRAHPELLSRSAGLAELDRPPAGGDVRRLIQVMLRPDGAAEDEAPPDHDRELTERFRALDEADREAIAAAAAWTLARGWAKHDLLRTLDPEDVAAFGLEPNADSTGWRILGPENCRTILSAYSDLGPAGPDRPAEAVGRRLHPLDALVVDLVLPEVRSALSEGARHALVLLRGIRLHRNAAVVEVIRRTWADRALHRWIRQAHPAWIAELLVTLNVWLSDAVVRECLRTLVRRLGEMRDEFTVQDTLMTLRCLRAYLSEITAEWRPVSDWAGKRVVAALTGAEGTPGERYQLLRRTESFYDPVLQEVIAEHAVDVLPGVDPSQADDYYLVRRVRSLQNRAERALHWEQTWHPIDQEEAVQSLLDTPPPETAGFHVLLGWLTLRQYFREATWETLLDQYEQRFPQAMRYTSSHEFTRAINELHRHGTVYANAIFMRALRHNPRRRVQESQPFFEAVRKLLHESTPIVAAEMVHSVASVHVHAAYRLLYPDADVPDDELAATMAHRVFHQADTKGAGMLLSVTQAIDDVYLVRSTGFAHAFGFHLGAERVRTLLIKDPRPSVKYYLIKGLSDAQVPFRGELMSTVREIVVDAVTRARKPWGPRLALQLGSDPEIGQDFLRDLRDHVSLQNLLDGMSRYAAPEAQTEYHRLSRALYPEAASRYARAFDVESFLGTIAAAAPVPAVECCREVGRTLADADDPDQGRSIVRAADRVTGESDSWANRLARTRTGEQMVQALNILLDVDRPTARSVVAVLGHRIGEEDRERSESLLVWKVRQAMFDSPTAAASLLKTLEDAEPGLGRVIYEHLREESALPRVFAYELQAIQSASAQYAAVRHLAAIGVLPDQTDTHWMTQNFEAKLSLIPHRASPRVLADTIRMFAIGKRTWADRAVRCIDHDKLAARLQVGITRDLEPAVGLAALLYSLDRRDDSARIVASLCERDPAAVVARLGLREASVLLELVTELRPEHVGTVSNDLCASIDARMSQPVILNEREQWMEIGYACHRVHEAGAPVTVDGTPHLVPNLAHYPAVAWGLQRLPASVWQQQALVRASDWLLSREPAGRTALFCLLACGAGLGRLGNTSRLVGDGSSIADLSFRQLRVLHELAERDGALAALLSPAEDRVRAALAEPVARISWDAYRLTASLARLAQQRDGAATQHA
jgi:hypothetical protein